MHMTYNCDQPKLSHPAKAAYDSVDDFVQAFVDDELVIYNDADALFVPDRLIAGGTGIRCRFNPTIGEGATDIFRPFPGILILIVNAKRHDTAARNKLIAEQAHSMDKFLYALLVNRGKMRLRFGSSEHEVTDGGGLLFTYKKPQIKDAFLEVSNECQFVHIFMTQNGVVNASARLGIPIPKAINALKRDIPQCDSFFPIHSSPNFEAFIRSIVEPTVSDGVRSSYLRAKFGEMLCHISSSSNHLSANDEDIHHFEVMRLAKAKQFLDENISGKYDINDVARHIGLNKSRLSTGFKNRYRVSIRDYRLELRLGRAYALLSQTSMSIEQISIRCGYQNVGNFSRAFKSRFGSSPSLIRRS